MKDDTVAQRAVKDLYEALHHLWALDDLFKKKEIEGFQIHRDDVEHLIEAYRHFLERAGPYWGGTPHEELESRRLRRVIHHVIGILVQEGHFDDE